MDDLLPCPFCGPKTKYGDGLTILEYRDVMEDYTIEYTVRCGSCGITMTEEYSSDLAKKWNTRLFTAPGLAAEEEDEDE